MPHEAIVVGAGLAGLTAAYRLAAAGVDVTVLEARERPGGRVFALPRSEGGHLEGGGELVLNSAPCLVGIAGEVGVELLPPRPVSSGAFVRLDGGRRVVEAAPLASDPAAADAFDAGATALGQLAEGIDRDAPWTADNARALDARTLGDWLSEHVEDRTARAALAGRFGYLSGAPHELSLLFALWYVRSAADAQEFFEEPFRLLDGGPSRVAQRLAERLGERVRLGEPVRSVEHDEAGVRLTTDLGVYSADAAIVALSPALCTRIEWRSPLPPARERLQQRWLSGRGLKAYAIYDSPWWREEGLSGDAAGGTVFEAVTDLSPTDGSHGRLLGFHTPNGDAIGDHLDSLTTPAGARAAFLDALEEYFGPRAREVTELHVSSFYGDLWSAGCGSGASTGLLSSVGPSLRAPVGRLLWAGEETGPVAHMEGAVASGERVAREALGLLDAAQPTPER